MEKKEQMKKIYTILFKKLFIWAQCATLTIFQFVLTVQKVFADTSRVVPGAQRLFDALNHVAQVSKGLKYLCILVW